MRLFSWWRNKRDLISRIAILEQEISTLRCYLRGLYYIVGSQRNSPDIWRSVVKDAVRKSRERVPGIKEDE